MSSYFHSFIFYLVVSGHKWDQVNRRASRCSLSPPAQPFVRAPGVLVDVAPASWQIEALAKLRVRAIHRSRKRVLQVNAILVLAEGEKL